ncbi:hypothetical protein SO802_024635 [Lithocarpus litseifolius]|uniref:RNase H type-1 domain-containing protein n=1 Tax=Lithocarpus litseifolius TaxID=425828 RepID=A0AAW2CA09_9ROSI
MSYSPAAHLFLLPLNDCRFLLSQFQHFKVIHVYREANRVANKLAKEGCSCPFDFDILDCPNSEELCNILCSDASGLYTLRRNATTLSGLKFGAADDNLIRPNKDQLNFSRTQLI